MCDPVNGQRCLFWLEKGLSSPGLGDTPEGLQHIVVGTYFENASAFHKLHPRIGLPEGYAEEAFIVLDEARTTFAHQFSHWRPGPMPPGEELPEGMLHCNTCGNVMRKVPTRSDLGGQTDFHCPDCDRYVTVSIEVKKRGAVRG